MPWVSYSAGCSNCSIPSPRTKCATDFGICSLLPDAATKETRMRQMRTWSLALGLIFGGVSFAGAQPPSYVKQVKPFLAKYCVECHNPDKLRGDLDLSTVKALVAGGKSGAAFVPGKADESYLVTLTEGKDTPKMPPKTARAQPTAVEVALL